MNGFYLQETIALDNFNRRVRSNQLGDLKVELFSAHWTMFILRVFVVPNYSTVALLNKRTINVVAVLLHYLLENLEPVFVEYLEQCLPLTIYAVLVAALRRQP